MLKQRAFMVLHSRTSIHWQLYGETVKNIEKEQIKEEGSHGHEEDEERLTSREPSRPSSADSTSSSNKRRKKDKDSGKGKEESLLTDPLLAMISKFRGDLQSVSQNFGNIAVVWQCEADIQDKARKEKLEQKIEETSVQELHRLGFTGSEVIKAASVFVKAPNQMNMLLAVPDSLRREFILIMLEEEANKK